MPKEKATRKTKAKVADAGGKKKKGGNDWSPRHNMTADLSVVQTLMRPSAASQRTCFLPTSSATMFERRTQESALV